MTPKIPLAEDEDHEDSSNEHRNLHGTQPHPDHAVEALHLPDGGAIRALDPLMFISHTEARLPVDLEDLVPHRYHREDGRDAACSRHECGRIEGESVWYGDHIDVVLRALSQGRKRACGLRASEAKRGEFVVGELGRVVGDSVARAILRDKERLDTKELDD